MTTPGWIPGILAALMLVVAAVSATRLIVGRPWRRGAADAGIDGAHLLMGIAMAGMLVASLSTLPDGGWDVIFGVMTAWFAWRVYRESRGRGARVLAGSHHAPHLVHSAAMVYMFVALTDPTAAAHGTGMGSMGTGTAMPTASAPVLAFIFAVLLAGYAVVDLDRLPGPFAHGKALTAPAMMPAGAALAGGSAAGAAPGPDLAAVPGGAGAATQPGQEAAPGQEPGPGLPAGGGRAAGGAGSSARRVLLSPRTAAACRIAMGVTMAFMLISMI